MTGAIASIINLAAGAIAAMATAVLAVFAKRQWRVMSDNNKAADRQNALVRERWKREDELRVEEKEPKAVFWLDQPSEGGPVLWCANVGLASFVVLGMRINPLIGESSQIPFKPKHFSVVPVGESKSFSLTNPEVMFGTDRPGNVEIKLVFAAPRAR